MLGDIYNISERIKKIDKRFSVQRNADGSFTILQDGMFFQNVPHKEFDARVLKNLEKTIYVNTYGDIFGDIDKANHKAEKAKDDNVMELSREMAKDMSKLIARGV